MERERDLLTTGAFAKARRPPPKAPRPHDEPAPLRRAGTPPAGIRPVYSLDSGAAVAEIRAHTDGAVHTPVTAADEAGGPDSTGRAVAYAVEKAA